VGSRASFCNSFQCFPRAERLKFLLKGPGFRRRKLKTASGSWAFPDQRVKGVAQQPEFTDDWDKERKKQKILSLIFVVALAIVAVLIALSVLRGHL
jgi:hypothetical protein